MQKLCSCVILNYNDWKTTVELVHNIDTYTSLDYIVIVDNCSTDKSFDELKKLQNERIICLRTESNKGYGYGNNYGIRYSREILNCKYVVLSNPDVVFDNRYVEESLLALDKYDAACVAGLQLDVNGNAIDSLAWKIPTAFQYAVMGTKLGKLLSSDYSLDQIKHDVTEVECLPGALLVYDAEKFLNVGGYDENMFLFCEETAIGIKFKRMGYKSLLLKKIIYKHMHSVSINKSLEGETKKKQMIFDSRKYLLVHYYNANAVIMSVCGLCQNYQLKRQNKRLSKGK